MKHQIFAIHGGNISPTYEDYLEYLHKMEVTIEKLRSSDWKTSLGEKLGGNFEVILPRMPNSKNAKYLEWRIYFEKFIPLMEPNVILIGHSLGGAFLAKYLSEETFPKQIRATFLVAAPFLTSDLHLATDFILPLNLKRFAQQGGDVHLYHSEDDIVVPFSHMQSFQQTLPQARCTAYQDRGHFTGPAFPELIKDIQTLFS